MSEYAISTVAEFHEKIARSGSVKDILMLAGISKLFRENYAATINWARKKRQLKKKNSNS